MFEETNVPEKMRRVGADSHILNTATAEELLAAIRGKGTDA